MVRSFFIPKYSYNIKNINIAQLLSICYNKSDKKEEYVIL